MLGGTDGLLSNLRLGTFGENVASLTVGTSGALRFVSNKPPLHSQMEIICYVLDRTHWVIGGATSNVAGLLAWANQTLMKEVVQETINTREDAYTTFFSEISFVPSGVNGLLFCPYLLGEYAPLWEPEAFSSFLGLRRDHTEKEMMRAVLEGICFNLKRILTGVCKQGQVVEIRATGGFS